MAGASKMRRREDDEDEFALTGEVRTPLGDLNAAALASCAMALVSGLRYDRLDASQKTVSASIQTVLRMGSVVWANEDYDNW